MADYKYSPLPSKLPAFFEKIRTIGKPDKVTQRYLESIGFKSSNDRYIIGILKALDLLDSAGVPTQRWQAYRDKKRAPAVMAASLREAYSDLFDVYPDAYRKDDEALRNFFRSKTTVGEKAVSFMVRTFKTLSGLADFAAAAPVGEAASQAPSETPEPHLSRTAAGPPGMTININIQFSLPETKDSSIYDKIFESLKKHLMS